jgi:uncharacterized membrane protein YbhN (UPF0104 family)
LFLGFVFDAVAWHNTINQHESINVKLSDSISSMGISVFGKYIPGKLWIVLGRATYLAKRYDLDEKECAVISLNTQFISLWVGSLLGGLGVFLTGGDLKWAVLALGLWLVLTLILFTRWPYRLIESSASRIFKKQFDLPSVHIRQVGRVLPWFFVNWLLWITSFYYLVDALTIGTVSYVVGFVFAIGATVGIVVILAPGGVGVREGIIFAFLIICGMEPPIATTVSVTSRMWFLTGEVFIFIFGIFLQGRPTRQQKSPT